MYPNSRVVSGNSTPPLRTPIKCPVKITYEGDVRFSLYHIFSGPQIRREFVYTLCHYQHLSKRQPEDTTDCDYDF
jgi:hypothetical protein